MYVENSELIGPLGLIVMADHVLQCSTPCTKICITVIYNSPVQSWFFFYATTSLGGPASVHWKSLAQLMCSEHFPDLLVQCQMCHFAFSPCWHGTALLRGRSGKKNGSLAQCSSTVHVRVRRNSGAWMFSWGGCDEAAQLSALPNPVGL